MPFDNPSSVEEGKSSPHKVKTLGSTETRKRPRDMDEVDESCSDPNVPDIKIKSEPGILVEIEVNGIITEAMKAEEEALMLQSEAEEKRLVEEAKAQLERETAEDEAKRIVLLKHLLAKSKFFATHIASRVQSLDNQFSKKDKRRKKVDRLAMDKKRLDEMESGSSKSVKTSEVTQEEEVGTRITSMGFEVSTRQPLLLEGAVMRDYQIFGYEWIRSLTLNGVNGILADEMGLGKTVQTIAYICFAMEKGLPCDALIVAPLSTLANWVSEFERFAPKIPVLLYHGKQPDRAALLPKMNKRVKVKLSARADGYRPVIVTSYEVAMKDRHPLQDRKWDYVIIDEGHRIKNYKCKLVKELKKYKSETRLLLTGTPLQNNLTELWSLLNYLLPDLFSDLSMFESWFAATDFSTVEGDLEATTKRIVRMEEQDNIITTLHKILEPFMLRRIKTEVELCLPPKKELLVFTPLTPVQDEMYRAILNRSIHDYMLPEDAVIEDDVKENDGSGLRKRLRRSCNDASNKLYNIDSMNVAEFEKVYNASLKVENQVAAHKPGLREKSIAQGFIASLNPCSPCMDMRKLVNHPYLIRLAVVPGTQQLRIDEELVTSSGKMMVLDAMLAKLKERGHKVLIFSQLIMMLDMIEEYMIMRDYRYCRLDGSRDVMDRKENIELFNTDPSIFCFLVSTRAGGLGINLTAADTVIIYDSDWNPQCDLQAQDRCHRIGQTRPVVVYRLTTDGTIDRRMVERATGKRRLEKLVIKKGRFHGAKSLGQSGSGFSAHELLDLLNSKDYVKSIQSNGYVYTDEELNDLLDRNDLMSTQEAAEKTSKNKNIYEVVE